MIRYPGKFRPLYGSQLASLCTPNCRCCSYSASMVAMGQCTITCGRCICPGQCFCSDVPPDGSFTCAQQVCRRTI